MFLFVSTGVVCKVARYFFLIDFDKVVELLEIGLEAVTLFAIWSVVNEAKTILICIPNELFVNFNLLYKRFNVVEF